MTETKIEEYPILRSCWLQLIFSPLIGQKGVTLRARMSSLCPRLHSHSYMQNKILCIWRINTPTRVHVEPSCADLTVNRHPVFTLTQPVLWLPILQGKTHEEEHTVWRTVEAVCCANTLASGERRSSGLHHITKCQISQSLMQGYSLIMYLSRGLLKSRSHCKRDSWLCVCNHLWVSL